MTEWKRIVEKALCIARTPVFVFSERQVKEAVAELEEAIRQHGGLPIRNWLSLKSHPLPELVRSWSRAGGVWKLSASMNCWRHARKVSMPNMFL